MYSSNNSSSNSSVPAKIYSPNNSGTFSGGIASRTNSPLHCSKTNSPLHCSRTNSPLHCSRTNSPLHCSRTNSPLHCNITDKINSSNNKRIAVKNDSNNNMSSSQQQQQQQEVRPPASVVNCSPYDHQLLERLVPRHITTEHVVFSHKTKVGGRSLYFFSPAARGGLTKPVFTTREKLISILDGPPEDEDEESEAQRGASPVRRRSSNALGGGSSSPGRHGGRRRREELSPGLVCTIKRVHLRDPACDLGVSVWRGRGPQRGLQGPQRPPVGTGPALLVEGPESGDAGDGMVVAAGYTGEVMFLLPHSVLGRTELEPRAIEIFVQESMLWCVSESVVWFVVRRFTRRKVLPNTRQLSHQLNLGKLNLRSPDLKKMS
nr:uncharacterized protein LOC123765752 [Procambarus clarkii]